MNAIPNGGQAKRDQNAFTGVQLARLERRLEEVLDRLARSGQEPPKGFLADLFVTLLPERYGEPALAAEAACPGLAGSVSRVEAMRERHGVDGRTEIGLRRLYHPGDERGVALKAAAPEGDDRRERLKTERPKALPRRPLPPLPEGRSSQVVLFDADGVPTVSGLMLCLGLSAAEAAAKAEATRERMEWEARMAQSEAGAARKVRRIPPAWRLGEEEVEAWTRGEARALFKKKGTLARLPIGVTPVKVREAREAPA